jgi:hypothetical protein
MPRKASIQNNSASLLTTHHHTVMVLNTQSANANPALLSTRLAGRSSIAWPAGNAMNDEPYQDLGA